MPEQIVDWRVRENMIDYLGLAGSFELQAAYQAAVPLVHVPSEIVNQWEDWVHDPEDLDVRSLPAYSPEEVVALKGYQDVWLSVSKALGQSVPDLATLHGHPEWLRLTEAAKAAKIVMMRRGPSPPDRPADPGD